MLTKQELKGLRLARIKLLDEKCNPCGETDRRLCEECPVFRNMQLLNYKIEKRTNNVDPKTAGTTRKRRAMVDSLLTPTKYKGYKSKNMLDTQIAEVLNISVDAIYRWKRKHGLATRDSTQRALTDQQARNARKLVQQDKFSCYEVAKRYNVQPSTIEKLVKGETYKDVL